ncbi:hypothetical protein M5E87_13915 [Flavonifractor plautii]|nr:hypothetical protein M5E87_13915 [Flavonifractor plautii]
MESRKQRRQPFHPWHLHQQSDQRGQGQGDRFGKSPSGASVVRCHLDWDDGRYIYEIKMVSGTMEYECDINAATGVITDWDVDSIYD